MDLRKAFYVGSVIEKLPPSWNDFKIHLKHKKTDMSMEDLILKLQVQEDHRKSEGLNASVFKDKDKANVIKGGDSSKPKPKFQNNKRFNNKGKCPSVLAPKGKNFKAIKGACWVYGKTGHKVQNCHHKKSNPATNNNNNQANVAEEFVGVISEVNMMIDSKDWWVDTGATRHICNCRR